MLQADESRLVLCLGPLWITYVAVVGDYQIAWPDVRPFEKRRRACNLRIFGSKAPSSTWECRRF